MNKTGIIYKATSITTGKTYIGQTVKILKERIRKHTKAAFNPKNTCKFHLAIRKYTPEDFTWIVLHRNIPISQLNYLECLEIIYHNSYEDGYNSSQGGDHNPMDNLESRRKMRETLIGRKIGPFSVEHRQKIRQSNLIYWRNHLNKSKERSNKVTLSRHCFSEEKKNRINTKIGQALKTYFSKNKHSCLKITEEEVIKIRQLYLSNISITEIKEILNLQYSTSTIKGIANGNHRKRVKYLLQEVRDFAIRNRSQKLSFTQIKDIKILIQKGFSNKEISKRFSVSCGQIWKIKTNKQWSSI